MRKFTRIAGLKKYLNSVRAEGRRIGFVPTMGFFHEGHLDLMRVAKKETDCVVISIFVNPTQFGPNEDYRCYPHDLKRDERLAGKMGAEVIFYPSVKEMYPKGFSTHVEVERLSGVLCGASRPGHFRGVTTVVMKLLNIVEPDAAYFGRKDAQQAIIIKKMVRDLNVNTGIRVLPTIRERDGLAMSSRNIYLNAEERKDALLLSRSLLRAAGMIKSGERDVRRIISTMRRVIGSGKSAEIDYVAVVDSADLTPAKKITGDVLIALAVRIGAARLIDNLLLKRKKDGTYTVTDGL